DKGFVPPLIELMSSPFTKVRTQAAWALGNIAGENADLRDYLLKEGILLPLLEIWKRTDDRNEKRSALHVAIWVYANICRWKSRNWEQLSIAFPTVEEVLTYKDDDIVSEACWALSRIFHGRHKSIDLFLRQGVCQKMVYLLKCVSLYGE
ncbi:hypothetical protein HK096_009791, partial [Nowakowskiella sp. JEL0078]